MMMQKTLFFVGFRGTMHVQACPIRVCSWPCSGRIGGGVGKGARVGVGRPCTHELVRVFMSPKSLFLIGFSHHHAENPIKNNVF